MGTFVNNLALPANCQPQITFVSTGG